tara:strand:- start:34 stop:609 length:576 start_codon:yes stop_codon:yes gene_type:complete
MPNVTSIKSQQFIFATDDDAVSVSAAATSLAILNGGPWANAQTITLKSSANNTGNTFTIVGTDADGDAQTTTRVGPNAGSVDVSGTWKSVTSITSSGAIATDIQAGIKSGATSGTFYAGRTRIRGMTGVGAGAGIIFFKNASTTGVTQLALDVKDDTIDPYIPDNGIMCADGAYFQITGTSPTGLTVFYDG